MAQDGRISPRAELGLAPRPADAGVPGPLPLEAADHHLRPVAGGGVPQPIAAIPTAIDFSRFARLAEFAFSPPDARPAPEHVLIDPPPDGGIALPGAADPVVAPPPREQPPDEARLTATRIFCQQLVGNHAATGHFLNPTSDFAFIRKALQLDTERRILVIDSLVDIVRSGHDQAAAANIVDQIQGYARDYLDNSSTEDNLDAADRILPRLVQRVEERDTAGNRDPLWLRLVAIANLFGRPMRRLAPSQATATEIRVGAGVNTLESDASFAAALAAYNPADPANSPLARVVNSNQDTADVKGKFRKFAYDARINIRLVDSTISSVAAEYPSVLYTISNVERCAHYRWMPNQAECLLHIFRDRYIMLEPQVCRLISPVIYHLFITANADRQIWAQFENDILPRLRNQASLEIRQEIDATIRRIAQRATDPWIIEHVQPLLTNREQTALNGEILFRGIENRIDEGPAKAVKVANYITGAPGFVVGSIFGLVGGAIFGFFKGLIKGCNPFKTAAINARKGVINGSVFGSLILGGFIGALLVATPFLAARVIPKRLPPASKGLSYLFGLPGVFIGGAIAGLAGAVVGFFVGLYTGKHPFLTAGEFISRFATIGAQIGIFAFGGFIGTGLGLVFDLAIKGLSRLVDDRYFRTLPRFLNPDRAEGSAGGTIGALVTGLPGAIVCGAVCAIIGGILGLFAAPFVRENPLTTMAQCARGFACLGIIYGGFALGGFIGYLPGRLIGRLIENA